MKNFSSYRTHKEMLMPTPWPQLQQPNFLIKKIKRLAKNDHKSAI